MVATLALCLLALTAMYSRNFGQCLQFPNGSEIGYEAIVDFGGPYFRPDAVLRLPQIGIVAKEVWPSRKRGLADSHYRESNLRVGLAGNGQRNDRFQVHLDNRKWIGP